MWRSPWTVDSALSQHTLDSYWTSALYQTLCQVLTDQACNSEEEEALGTVQWEDVVADVRKSTVEAEATCDSWRASKRSRVFPWNIKWVYSLELKLARTWSTKYPVCDLRIPPSGAKAQSACETVTGWGGKAGITAREALTQVAQRGGKEELSE